MASQVTIRTQAVTRKKLADFLDNHQLVKLLENLTQDVSVNIPGGLDAATDQLEAAAELAQLAQSLAASAQGLAEHALARAALASEGPPPAVFIAPDTPEDLFAQFNALRDRVATLERALAETKEGPSP